MLRALLDILRPLKHWYCLPLLALLVVTTLLLMPRPYDHVRAIRELKPMFGRGYIVHLVAYWCLTASVLWMTPPRWWRLVGVSLAAHAFITEAIQFWLPTRDCDPADAVANLLGIALGAASVLVLRRKQESLPTV